MIQEAFISGQLAKAIYRDDRDTYFVLGTEDEGIPRPAGTGEIRFLCGLRAEFKKLPTQGLNLEVVRAQLRDQERNATTLFLMVSGLDTALSTEARTEARSAAEEMLSDEKVAQFVRDRMLSRPAPADCFSSEPPFDPKSPIASSIYSEVFSAQETIEDVAACWNAALEAFFSTSEEQRSADQILMDSGFLADLVQAIQAGANDKVNGIVVDYALKIGQERVIPHVTHLLNDFRMRLAVSFPAHITWRPQADSGPAAEEVNPYLELTYNFNYFDPSRRQSKLTAFESVTQVKKQIGSIRGLLFSGNIHLAEKYVRELLEFNLEHGERQHVGMTLCNLAGIALQANELEMAEYLSEIALGLGLEHDPVVFVTHAEVLRWSARFQEALKEYEQIKIRFPSSCQGFSAYAEVLKDMGRFQESLISYEHARDKWPDEPVPHNGYAGVLVSMGKRDEAASYLKIVVRRFNDVVSMTQYSTVLSASGKYGTAIAVSKKMIELFPRDVSGYITYARTLRRAWMLEEALTAYEEVARRFPDSAIGLSGRAEILKRMGRLRESLEMYDSVIKAYPNNPLTMAGRASVRILLGESRKVVEELSSQRLSSENDWRAHYLVSLSYLQGGDLDNAIARMTLGFHTSPWLYLRGRYAMGLGVAMLKKQQASEAKRVLATDLDLLDFSRRQQRIVVLSHAHAAVGEFKTAFSLLQTVSAANDIVLTDLKRSLIAQYGLGSSHQKVPVVLGMAAQIAARELFLAVNT